MNITITDGAETQTINTGAAVDAALQEIVDELNNSTDPVGTTTRAQYLKGILVNAGQSYFAQRMQKRKERLAAKFEAATEAKRQQAETLLA